MSRKERIHFIKHYSFEADLDEILKASLAGPVHKKVESLTAIAYNLAKEWFSKIEWRSHNQPSQQPNKRESERHHFRSEIKILNKQFKTSTPAESEVI